MARGNFIIETTYTYTSLATSANIRVEIDPEDVDLISVTIIPEDANDTKIIEMELTYNEMVALKDIFADIQNVAEGNL